MNKTVIVNIYNFVRMSHQEPSRFQWADFDTLRRQMDLVGQYGFPATYALKYDALTEPRYQQLLKQRLEEGDEVGCWLEISQPLCEAAGVPFRDSWREERYDNRVNSAYAIGYEPEERWRIVDAYMAAFFQVFGYYPKTVGSWVLDSVTLAYAAERYGVVGGAMCRDQQATDGFTLWGGFPNGVYFPSRNNENIPAQTREGQLDAPVFRMLGPDPIYNFEQDVRPGLQGVYTLEPAWLPGRDDVWLDWYGCCLTEEDTLGISYAQVGQENNFLWENIRPGLQPQLERLHSLSQSGKVRVETMADTAVWLRTVCPQTIPTTFQASRDWSGRGLSAQWYACANYRVGFLGEAGHLRIRDCFVYRQDYPSRYRDQALAGSESIFDALPVLYPQAWQENGNRPFLRLLDENGREPSGTVRYRTLDRETARAELLGADGDVLAAFTAKPHQLRLAGPYQLVFDRLPVFDHLEQRTLWMCWQGFPYAISTSQGRIVRAGADGVALSPENGEICLTMGAPLETPELPERPKNVLRPRKTAPPMAPTCTPVSRVFPWGSVAAVTLAAGEEGEIVYTLDGRFPGPDAPVYTKPLTLTRPAVLTAVLRLPDGRVSEAMTAEYRFGLKTVELSSPTNFDPRPVFQGGGVTDLLLPQRGSLDYLDGRWRGTTEDLVVAGRFPELTAVGSIGLGFLTHHRSGIVYPASVELYTGAEEGKLVLTDVVTLPNGPAAAEIEKQDVVLPVHAVIRCFRLIARRYPVMPDWCTYRGTETVFTLADNLTIVPEK